jgi:hypothetical protein
MPSRPLGSRAYQNARNKIQFNGVDGLRTYINFTRISQRIGQNKIHDQENGPARVIHPIVTPIVAVVGTADILNDFGPGNDS